MTIVTVAAIGVAAVLLAAQLKEMNSPAAADKKKL